MGNQSITLQAHSKINLALDVVRRRPDGYHEVRMIMQTLGLCDTLVLSKTEEQGIKLETNIEGLSCGPDNLICKAGKLLMDEFKVTEGVHAFLTKRIPIAAGMAGGSTDAAAMLVGINELFSLHLDRKALMERGVKIGADVPYCILCGTALAEGIGEKLTRLSPMPQCPVLIAKPSISVSTKFVYQNLKLDENTRHPAVDCMIEDIKQKNLEAVASRLGNVLETVTVPDYPVISRIKETMKADGALNAMMSGSGPTVFGLFSNMETAQKAYDHMVSCGLADQVFLTDIYNTPFSGQ